MYNSILQRLPRLPSWLLRFSWGALLLVILAAVAVFAFELRNFKRESDYTAQLMSEKGEALITALESALQTGMGFHWNDEELQFLMRRVGAGRDIRALVLLNANGEVVLNASGDLKQDAGHSPPHSSLPAAVQHEGLSGQVVESGHGLRFRISRRVFLNTGTGSQDMHGGHGHGGKETGSPSASSLAALRERPLWVVVDYDMQALLAAQRADRLHLAVLAGILVFLALLGAVVGYLLRKYMRSRRLAQESAAFAGLIVRTLPAGIIATDQQGRVTSINTEALRIMGAQEATVAGQELRRLAPALWDALGAPSAQGRAVLDMELRCAFGAEQTLPLAVSVSPLRTDEEQWLGHVFILRDLGEIRRLQSELRRRDRLASLGTLAAGVAHEVRNPLSAIKGIARYFEESYPPESDEGELARTLGQEVLRLDKVVGNLLDLARPDNIQRVPVPLDALVERARRMVKPALEAGGVLFAVHLPQEAEDSGALSPKPCLVAVDGDRLAQVLINLFLNAVEAMHDSPRRELTLRARITAEGRERTLHLDVEDSGCGIAHEDLQNIFSPYFTTKKRGTGLGLSIVHNIVEAHDGTIEAHNKADGGCTVSLHLPLPFAGEGSGA